MTSNDAGVTSLLTYQVTDKSSPDLGGIKDGYDMDSDGQYNEKSTFMYSSLTDRLLITIASGLNKPELLENVRKNLNMTLYYVHPNGEIVTDASGRQDKATIGTLENYYYPYRYLAWHYIKILS